MMATLKSLRLHDPKTADGMVKLVDITFTSGKINVRLDNRSKSQYLRRRLSRIEMPPWNEPGTLGTAVFGKHLRQDW